MGPQDPSRTALAAAAHPAAHQILDGGGIFADPLAARILGVDPEDLAREAAADPARAGMRRFIAARARIAEDAIAARFKAGGLGQLVALGAGLDTFACRSPYGEALRVFEVDHPATQAWKRRRLAEAAIAAPSWLTFVATDFEQDDLLTRLAEAGFDPRRPAIFTWLGVVPYLSAAAVEQTFRRVASLPGGAELVFDYSDPAALLAPAMRRLREARAARVAALGEPWRTHFTAADVDRRLRQAGFTGVEDLDPAAILARVRAPVPPDAPHHGGHVTRAWTFQA